MTRPMPTGPRKVGAAHLRITTPSVGAGLENLREITELEVPEAEQGRGYATSLMHATCREADKAGCVLMLTPQPFGDNIALSREQLVRWYTERFGFAEVQADPVVVLARLPYATPRQLQLKPLQAALYQAKKPASA